MTAAVGADVESICNKCGDVWHVVVAKVGDDIVKVQCKECGAYHRHRHPGARKGARSAPSKRRRAAGSGPVREQPVTFSPDPSAPVRPYSMREIFQEGEQISHPRFGIGLVERSSEPGKMSVLFTDGRRVLAQAKPSSGLVSADLRRAGQQSGD
jgi:hypothetical protein